MFFLPAPSLDWFPDVSNGRSSEVGDSSDVLGTNAACTGDLGWVSSPSIQNQSEIHSYCTHWFSNGGGGLRGCGPP